MKARITHVSYILDFLDKDFSSKEISNILELEVNNTIKDMHVDTLTDWEIQFRATYSNSDEILISKNRFGSFSSDKYKEITIVIPIPLKEIVEWGVRRDQYTFDQHHYDDLMKNFHSLPARFLEYKNLSDYIMDSIRQAIGFCFKMGYTVGGVKVKL